jgi:heme/copper-type cytochrome/quinol oxidase subunit 4
MVMHWRISNGNPIPLQLVEAPGLSLYELLEGPFEGPLLFGAEDHVVVNEVFGRKIYRNRSTSHSIVEWTRDSERNPSPVSLNSEQSGQIWERPAGMIFKPYLIGFVVVSILTIIGLFILIKYFFWDVVTIDMNMIPIVLFCVMLGFIIDFAIIGVAYFDVVSYSIHPSWIDLKFHFKRVQRLNWNDVRILRYEKQKRYHYINIVLGPRRGFDFLVDASQFNGIVGAFEKATGRKADPK